MEQNQEAFILPLTAAPTLLEKIGALLTSGAKTVGKQMLKVGTGISVLVSILTDPAPLGEGSDKPRNDDKKEDENDIIIYRSGSGSSTNLTPREVDVSGLSYYLERPDESHAQTTIKSIWATGKLKAVIDKPGHVSVTPIEFPADSSQMKEWIESRKNAEANPHPLTNTLKSISTRYDKHGKPR